MQRLGFHNIEWLSRLGTYLNHMTQPYAGVVTAGERRVVRLLLAIDLIVVFFCAIAVVAVLLVIPTVSEPNISLTKLLIYISTPFSTIVVAVLAHRIKQSSVHPIGAYLTMSGFFICTYGAIFTTPGIQALNYTPINIAGPLVASLYFSLRKTVQVSLLSVGGLGLTLHFHELVTSAIFGDTVRIDEFGRIIAMMNTLALNALLIVALRLRDFLEADRRVAEKALLEEQHRAEIYKEAAAIKSRFMAGLSHELRTPMNAILNYSAYVRDGYEGEVNPEQHHALNRVVDNSEHLLSLINDLLNFSKIEAGGLELFVESDVALAPIFEQLDAIATPLLTDKPVTFSAELPTHLPSFNCDSQRLFQVLLNLVSNACKFTKKGSVVLRVFHESDQLHFVVADTGPGIAETEWPQVFEPFTQTAAGLQTTGGTGLGLAISKSLVEAHGGHIWLKSELGVGTTFHVTLPLVPTVSKVALGW